MIAREESRVEFRCRRHPFLTPQDLKPISLEPVSNNLCAPAMLKNTNQGKQIIIMDVVQIFIQMTFYLF